MAGKEERLNCKGCETYGPSHKNAKWILTEPNLKLVYIETKVEEQTSATFGEGQGQCSVRDKQKLASCHGKLLPSPA